MYIIAESGIVGVPSGDGGYILVSGILCASISWSQPFAQHFMGRSFGPMP